MFGSGGTGFGGFGQQNQQGQQNQTGQTNSLFGAPQQPSTGTGFGGFGAQPTSTFGASAGGSLFGQPAQQQPAQNQPSSGFSFGQSTNNATSTPFGQQQNKPTGFGGFGATTSATPAPTSGFGGFGATQPTSTPFGGGTSTFGAKPAGSLFGAQPTSTFGQPAQTGGIFGNAGGLGASQPAAMPTQGTLNPPYELKPQPEGAPDTPYDHDKKTPPLLNYTSITCMKPYRGASLEELRLQDYEQGRKSGNGGAGAGGFGQSSTPGFGAPQSGGLFGQPQQQQQQQPAFGGGGLFGQANQQQQNTGGLFGSSGNTGGSLFGQQQQQQPQQAQTGGLFGQQTQQQPASAGFGFGSTPQQNTAPSSGFSFGQNNAQQQNKPAGSLFGGGGGFGQTNQAAGGTTSGFSFGASTNQQPATSGFGGNSGGFGFGSNTANANQPKPGGLFGAPATSTAPTFGGFGATSSAPGATDNKPAFSFGGFGGSTAGQASTAAPTGGLFANPQPTTTSQPTSGFSFGAPSNNTGSTGQTGGLFGGQQQAQPGATGFGAQSGGLFGNKQPATGGLFGQPAAQQQQQQPATGGFGFGANNNSTNNASGSLFGSNQQNKAAGGGLFGGLGNNSNQQSTMGGGLFGSTQSNTNALGGGTGGGLFGGNQSQLGGGSLFGNNNNNQQQRPINGTGITGGGLFGSSALGGSTGGGFNFGGQNNTQSTLGNSLFGGMQQQQQQQPNLQVSLNSNPYGTDALFGGQANSSTSSVLGTSANKGLNNQPHLPFNVSLSRSTAKKQPPIVPPFRPSPRNSTRITKLRGSTPGLRESTPVREGTPGPSSSLFSASSSPAPSGFQRLASPSPSIFRGLSDDLQGSQRESPGPMSLPPQAFVSRPSVKRLVLDDGNNSRSVTAGLNRSGSLFSARAPSTVREMTPGATFEREATPGRNHVNFSPALETAASARTPREAESSFTSSIFGARKTVEETPSKGTAGPDSSLPALRSSLGKQSKEDALLPLDYWTTPALSELREWSHAELQSVEGFIVGRKDIGSVAFDAPVDLTTVGELGIIPGGIVILRDKECMVYPDESDCLDDESGRERDGVQPGFEPRQVPGGKAPLGTGLNVPAVVKLDKCWPTDRSTRQPIKDPEHIRYKQLVNKLKRRSEAHFIDFEPTLGTWTFRVDHFSRYGLDETDEDATDEEGGDPKGKKAARRAGQLHETGVTRKGGDSNDYEDDQAPPTRALGDTTDDDSGDEGSVAESNVLASELGSRTPQASGGVKVLRGMTPLSSGTNQRASAAPSGVTPQPWAASLGLEPRRVQVMQASFFGQSNEATTPSSSSRSAYTIKQSRHPSPSFASSQPGTVASRTSFLKPFSAGEAGIEPRSRGEAAINVKSVADINPALMASSTTTSRPRKFSRREMASSVVDGGHDIVIDAGLYMGRSFRVGWGPGGVFAHSGRLASGTISSATSGDAVADSFSTVKMGSMPIFSQDADAKERQQLEVLLKRQLQQTSIEEDEDGNDCPAAFPLPTLRFRDLVDALEGQSDTHYETAIFKLGAALFDEVDTRLDENSDLPRHVVDEVVKLRRRNNVANWIRWYVHDIVRSEIRSQLASTSTNAGEQNVFTYLSGGFFEEACKQCIETGDVRLASLIAQASSGGDEEEFRLDLIDQLAVWRRSGADALISSEYRRIVELLSGNVTWSPGNGKREESEAVKDLQIAGGLDWVRTFALFLHYDARFDAGLDEVLERYESSIGGEADIVPPLPPYLDKEIRPGSQRFRTAVRSGHYHRDQLFLLLKLFCQPSYELENVLEPLSSSDNRLSYSLAFHVSVILSKVLVDQGGRDFSDRIDLGIDNLDAVQAAYLKGNSGKNDRLCVDFAMQLESLGLWKWAAFILLHLELSESRKQNIQALLARNVESFPLDTDRKSQRVGDMDREVSFLVQTLKIPLEWLYAAKSDWACSREDRWQEYKYSLAARDYVRAHRIAVHYLAPEGIIRHDFEFILELFVPFQRGAAVHLEDDEDGDSAGQAGEGDVQDVAGWSSGGQIFIDYIAICRSLPWLLRQASSLKPSPVDATAPGGKKTTLKSFEDDSGSAAAALSRLEQMAKQIPKLMQDIRDLFERFERTTTLLVAQTQMITSLYTCIRMLKSSPLVKHLELPVADEDTLATAAADKEGRQVPVEIENLQFFANDYCNMLVGAAA